LDISIIEISLAFIAALFAGFIDSVVGGGGLVQAPALLILFPEFSHVQVIATNRFASIFGTAVAAYNYYKTVGIDTAIVLYAGLCATLSSYLGTYIMSYITKDVFVPILIVVIILLTIYTYLNKSMGIEQEASQKPTVFTLMAIGTAVGLYNGVIGPGTGVLLLFGLVSIARLTFLKSSANAKIINAMADGGSLIGFIINAQVVYKVALPMMVGNVIGSYIGSKSAISKGNQYVRTIFLGVMILLIGRLIYMVLVK
jgi:uncharacterized protein